VRPAVLLLVFTCSTFGTHLTTFSCLFPMRTVLQLLLASVFLASCSRTPLQSQLSPQQSSSEAQAKRVGEDPDVDIAEYASLEEACREYHEESRVHDVIKERLEPYILERAYAVQSGEIDNAEFQRVTASAQQEQRDSDQRYLASQVAVLRSAGYSDWEMYSRYSVDGIGDLWGESIVDGEKVSENQGHPHYKYTYASLWSMDVVRLCKDN